MKYKVTTATEAHQVFDMLGIKNVSTRRQKKNGTQVYELPIQQMWQTCVPKPLRFACYRSGYVRNVSDYNSSAYQINKTKKQMNITIITSEQSVYLYLIMTSD